MVSSTIPSTMYWYCIGECYTVRGREVVHDSLYAGGPVTQHMIPYITSIALHSEYHINVLGLM